MFKKFIFIMILISLNSCVNSNINNKYFVENRPDEFAVKKNKELVIPTNFNLPTPIEKKNSIEVQYEDLDKNSLSKGEKNLVSKTDHIKRDKNINKKINKDLKPNKLKRIF